MSAKPGLVFGGIVASILLGLYAGTLVYMIWEVVDLGSKAGTAESITFNEGLVAVVTAAGGLVSALVISQLAVTEPGDDPGIMRIGANPGQQQSWWVTLLIWLYLSAWLVVGLSALVFGVMVYPGVSTTVSDIGTTWLGLAVASGYAYFAVRPKG